MDYEWTEWMDVPMGVSCPVQVGEIVETEWKTSERNNKLVLVMCPRLVDRWSEVSLNEYKAGHILVWKYRVKKPNIKAWLQNLETTPERELVKA